MIDVLRAHLAGVAADQRFNALREYLQRLVLQALDDASYRKNLAFVGGTALRIIYGTPRFSEDLDFSLLQPQGYDTARLNQRLLRDLERRGLPVDSSPVKDEKTVASFFIRFRDLLAPLKLAAAEGQKLSIKLEVDKRPPAGAHVEETLLPEPVICLVNHYDLPSMFATKLHAFLFRRYDKGRDYYDVFYFLGKKVQPSLNLFQNAVRQTHPEMQFPDLAALWEAVAKKAESLDEKQALKDVRPFLLNAADERFITKAYLLKAIDQARRQSAQ
jgi:predicted nucleotidyltransferase component of viral defense system